MARPQHPKSCGISSLTSVWNYLYSTLGAGSHQPISTEEALEVLGYSPPYNDVQFGKFTGNGTLQIWFNLLNKHFRTKGRTRICYKLHGKDQTHGISEEEGCLNLKRGLQSENKAYIYHCWNHYFCPIGFEDTPTKPYQAYSAELSEWDTWIMIGEVSKCYPPMHVVRWRDIHEDINQAFPNFINVRKLSLGVQ